MKKGVNFWFFPKIEKDYFRFWICGKDLLKFLPGCIELDFWIFKKSEPALTTEPRTRG